MFNHTKEGISDITNNYSNRNDFSAGVKAGVAIAIGYIPIAITFGVVTRSSGIPGFTGVFMSLMVFAGASQFIGVNLLAMGASAAEIAITTFILNFRHFLMTSSLSQRIKEGTPSRILYILAFGVTDETFAIASLRKEDKLSPFFILGLNLIAYTSWCSGTAAGILLGDALPQMLKSSMGIALYAMFIGLLIPSLRKQRPALVVTAVAVAVSSLLYWSPISEFIGSGWRVVISTILAAAAGAFLYGRKNKC